MLSRGEDRRLKERNVEERGNERKRVEGRGAGRVKGCKTLNTVTYKFRHSIMADECEGIFRIG